MIALGIATLRERESSFRQVIEAVAPQVDRIYCVLNNYRSIPLWLNEYDKVMAVVSDNCLGDIGKLYGAEVDNSYYLTLDDDLVPRSTYVADMIAAVDKYRCIVSLHGKKYRPPISDWRKDIYVNVRCLSDAFSDIEVHVGGTGCMAWHTDDFKVSIDMFEKKNMLDVLLAREAHRQGVKIMALAHPKDYFKYIKPRETIWDKNEDGEYQTGVINNFLQNP